MNAPTNMVLVETYLKLHFQGVPAAVFFDPLGNGDRAGIVANLAKEKDPVKIIHASIYILPRPLDNLALFVDRLDEDTYGYVAAWDGDKFITENT
jgi:hypothetical protein